MGPDPSNQACDCSNSLCQGPVYVYGQLTDNGAGVSGLPMTATWYYKTVTRSCYGTTDYSGTGSCSRDIKWQDPISVLLDFKLLRSEIQKAGGNKSPIAKGLNGKFAALGWQEKKFDTKIVVDALEMSSPTHKVDYFKNKVAVETEWNNKDPFYDRDLNNFRLLFDLRVIDVGVMITRCDELQQIFNELGRGPSYGESTTHMRKLLPKVQGGGAGGCPLLVFGITRKLYVED